MADGMAYQPGYITKGNQGAADDIEQTRLMFTGNNIRLYRDYNIMPVTQLAGHKVHHKTWKAKFPTLEVGNPAYFNAKGPYYDDMTHQETSNQRVYDSNGANGIVVDVRKRYGGAPVHTSMPNKLQASLFPVGEMWNNVFQEIDGTNQSMQENHDKNMPFMFKQQDLPAADGKIFDYTTTITLESCCVIEYELDHTGGNPQGAITSTRQAGMAHHLYGSGGLAGFLRTASGSAYPSLSNAVLIKGTTANTEDAQRLNAPFGLNEVILNTGLVTPTIAEGDKGLEMTGYMTRSKTKKMLQSQD